MLKVSVALVTMFVGLTQVSADDFINYYDQTIWVKLLSGKLDRNLSHTVMRLEDLAAEYRLESITDPAVTETKVDRILYSIRNPVTDGGALVYLLKKDIGLLNISAWFYDKDKTPYQKENQEDAVKKLLSQGYTQKSIPAGSGYAAVLSNKEDVLCVFQTIKLSNGAIASVILLAKDLKTVDGLDSAVVKLLNQIEPSARDQ